MNLSGSRSRNLFLLLCVGCVLATLIFGIVVARGSRPSSQTPGAKLELSHAPSPTPSAPSETPRQGTGSVSASKESKVDMNEVRKSAPVASAQRTETAGRLLYFRANALGENYGKLSVAPLHALDQPRYSTELSCDRVHFASGKGVCLASDRGVFTTYSAVRFDEQLQPGWSMALNGIPSRVRVSPSGHFAAITVFLSGHSYASLNFSTQTLIINADSGEVLADLEKFPVSRDGAAFESPDFNFWGVTFANDENRFYATLWSKGKTYLVECNFAERTAKVIYEGVECPSLSPDNTRIAFKSRTGRINWRIWLLDLRNLTSMPLGETRSVDDQVEWLDNEHVLYALSENEKGASASTDIWSLPTSPNGTPQVLLRGAYSPAVVPSNY
jgi:hypothetical protein